MSMTPEQVKAEMREAQGRDPTEAEMANWTRFGHEGQLVFELKAQRSFINEDGNTVTGNDNMAQVRNEDGDLLVTYYHKGNRNLGTWMTTAKNGTLALLSDEAMESTELGRDLHKGESKGGYTQVIYDAGGGGVLGAIDDTLGTNLADTYEDLMPDWAKPIAGLYTGDTVTGGAITGKAAYNQGMGAWADMTGLKQSDLEMGRDVIAVAGLTILTAPVGGWGGAAYIAGQGAAMDANGYPVDWKQTGKRAAIAGAAGLMGYGLGNMGASAGTRIAANAAFTTGASKLSGSDWDDALEQGLISGGVGAVGHVTHMGPLMQTALGAGVTAGTGGTNEEVAAQIIGGLTTTSLGGVMRARTPKTDANGYPVKWNSRTRNAPGVPGPIRARTGALDTTRMERRASYPDRVNPIMPSAQEPRYTADDTERYTL